MNHDIRSALHNLKSILSDYHSYDIQLVSFPIKTAGSKRGTRVKERRSLYRMRSSKLQEENIQLKHCGSCSISLQAGTARTGAALSECQAANIVHARRKIMIQ
ncbi:hypothetical protein RvY_15474 [Ramazzottius varieornatus]|uniref:Uncharacterized protein n=1 Tax=Ramazzottius varieornatus TaxID=947166 RepID=A0A1D1VV13_RAMVA|nr:hypothetical protein RvY_15474 [Ramazzottius varieornatus]